MRDLSATAVAPSEPDGGEESRIFATGELLDGVYEIMQLLGRGGMGQVFEAHDHLLNRRVAIKAAWPNPLTPPLRNEARALAAFQHPSLVSVHTLGAHRGIDYLVMERVYGVSLTQHASTRWSSGQTFTSDEVLRILLPAAEGLSVVHRAGLVHRDIKPDNIMLTPVHRVVLMDFGLVLPEFDVNGRQRVAGSPPYMAPEALLNTAEPGSGHLVDIFGLGVLAYELLTGARPYQGTTIREVIAAHERGEPMPLSEARPDCPVGLSQVVQEMLNPNPQLRTQSAEAAAWQMRATLENRSQVEVAAVSQRKPLSVLIVDDDVDLAKILSFYVRQIVGRADIRVAHDGEEALRQIQDEEPEVMLLDLHMPRMNGVEVCMQLKGEGLAQSCSVISVSAGAQEHDVQLLHQLGIHHFLEKGSNLRERLRAVFGEVCGDRVLAAE
ncbi:MAG: protein kinase [Deltaproteobacteria bacterium]|jgi:serine/threonine-protein kinase|nr:protein kinase [Deltaproteobacteria bacterium]